MSHSVEEAMEEAKQMAQSIKNDTLGRPSEEQGGSRINNSYNKDRDPLN